MSSVKTYLYDPEREVFVTLRGALSNMRPTVAYCDYQNWSLQLRTGEGDDAKAFVIPPDVVTFTLAIDRDKKEATTPMIRATNDMITLSADRSILDFTVDAATEEAKTVLDGQTGSVSGYFELCGLDANARRVFRISFAIDLRGAVDPSGLNYPTPGLTPTPDLPAQTPTGDYVRRMVDGVRSWAKIACATIADVTASILSHNTDKSAHEGVLIPEVPDESALFVRQGSGVGEWRWFKTSEGVIFGTDLYNHKIAQNAHTELFATRIAKSEKGVANGVASLDANAKIPMSQIPSGIGGGLTNINDFDHPVMGVYTGNGLNARWDSGFQCLSLDVGEGLKTIGNPTMGELLRLVVDKAALGLLIKLHSFSKDNPSKSWLYNLTYFNGLKDSPAIVFANPDDYNGGGESTLSSYMPSYETGKGLLIVASVDSGVTDPENSSRNRMDSIAFFLCNNGLYIQRGDDGAWESLAIGEAPMDGRMYARMNGMWVEIIQPSTLIDDQGQPLTNDNNETLTL